MARWTELALKVASAKRLGGTPEGETAMKELSPFVTQTARRIHAQLGSLRRQGASDFVAISPALVWKKMEKFEGWYYRELSADVRQQALLEGSGKDWFGAWCFVELRYRYLDAGRDQADEQRVRSLNPAASVAGRPSDAVAEALFEFELGPDEIERVRRWDPLDGVILFCLTGQWDKVPADLWKEWVGGLGLAEPFPPDDYIRAPKTKKRAVLADSLNISRDVIYQRWLRLKNRFQTSTSSVESGQTA